MLLPQVEILNIVFAETLIVYIDLEKIVATSKAGVSIKKQVEKIHKNNITKFQKYENLKYSKIRNSEFLSLSGLYWTIGLSCWFC